MILHCEIPPVEDGYVDNLQPSRVFAGSEVLIVQNIPSVPTSKTCAFLKFNLGKNLPLDLLESGARSEVANLSLYVRLMNFFYNATVEIHSASGNWTENALTWNTMPQFDVDKYVSLDIHENGTWARWNVTGLIQLSSNSSEQTAFAVTSSVTDWKNLVWFDSVEYTLTNGTTAPNLELTFVEPYLTINTGFPNLPITVGTNVFHTGPDGGVRLLVPWGIYPVTIPDTIPLTSGTRAKFVGWSDRVNGSSRLLSVGNNVALTAKYAIQYELSASSNYGTSVGAGWYFDNTEATVSVNPTTVPVEGLEGWFGMRYVFDHWGGACTGTTLPCNVLMNHPQDVEAIWRVDTSQTLVAMGVLALAGLFIVLKRWRGQGVKRKGRKPTGQSKHRSRRPRTTTRR